MEGNARSSGSGKSFFFASVPSLFTHEGPASRNPITHHPHTHSLAGRAAHYGCDPASAQQHFAAATKLDPGRLDAWEGLAAARLAGGDVLGAAALYEELVSDGVE